MIGDKIASVNLKLAELAGKVDSDAWGIIKLCRAELLDAEMGARELENHPIVIAQPTNSNDLDLLFKEPQGPGTVTLWRADSEEAKSGQA
jgi:hypothetical protein